MPDELRQPAGVLHELGGDVVAIVVVTEGRVVAQVTGVLRCVVRQLMHLFDQTRYDHVADHGNAGDQHQVDDEDDHRAGDSDLAADRVDQRHQRKGEEQADPDQPYDCAYPPDQVQGNPARSHHQDGFDHAAERRRPQPHERRLAGPGLARCRRRLGNRGAARRRFLRARGSGDWCRWLGDPVFFVAIARLTCHSQPMARSCPAERIACCPRAGGEAGRPPPLLVHRRRCRLASAR